jgi:hypothetical protein
MKGFDAVGCLGSSSLFLFIFNLAPTAASCSAISSKKNTSGADQRGAFLLGCKFLSKILALNSALEKHCGVRNAR